MSKVNIDSLKDLIELIDRTNKEAKKLGENSITLNVTGMHGTGKTSVVKHIASSLGYKTITVDLSQFSDPADLAGVPSERYTVSYTENGETKEVKTVKSMLDFYMKNGAELIKVETVFSPPDWVIKAHELSKVGQKACVLFDDFTRNQNLMQAVMRILLEGKNNAWEFPDDTFIVCTSNPSNSGVNGVYYDVAAVDSAQSDRYRTVTFEFDMKAWLRHYGSKRFNNDILYFLEHHSTSLLGVFSIRELTDVFRLVQNIPNYNDYEKLLEKPENLLLLKNTLGTVKKSLDLYNMWQAYITSAGKDLLTREQLFEMKEKELIEHWDTCKLKYVDMFSKNKDVVLNLPPLALMSLSIPVYIEDKLNSVTKSNDKAKLKEKLINRLAFYVEEGLFPTSNLLHLFVQIQKLGLNINSNVIIRNFIAQNN